MSNNWVPPVPPSPAAAPPPQKKSKWWLYGLLGCGGLILVVVIVVVAAGAYLWQKVPKTQGEMLTKIIETANPNLQVVKLDEEAGSVTIKDKKTGKITTITLEDAKNGNISFESEDTGESVTLGAGAAEKLPSWVTPYPGAVAQGGMTGLKEGTNSGSVNYTTTDSVSQVAAFYKQTMTSQGFQLKDESEMPSSENYAMVVGNSADGKRTLTVSASSTEGQTTLQVTFEEKPE